MNERERSVIRMFDPDRDIEAAYRCYASGFYHNMRPIIDHSEPRTIKDFMLSFSRAVDDWVEEILAQGYDRIVVSTDSTVSYDSCGRDGFERVHGFPLKCFFYSLPGVDVRGYTCSMHIPPE